MGKLQVGAGNFEEATRTFEEVEGAVSDASSRAEACYNRYLAARQDKEKWDAALRAIQQAVSLDQARFAPFPCHHYKPKRILGAGAFGTAFLCHDECMNEDVVVKSLHAYDPEHGMEVFAEAHATPCPKQRAPVHHSRTHLRLRQRTR